jgi:hypothetical protein
VLLLLLLLLLPLPVSSVCRDFALQRERPNMQRRSIFPKFAPSLFHQAQCLESPCDLLPPSFPLALPPHCSCCRYFCRFILKGAQFQPRSEEASIDSFWRLFPPESKLPRLYNQALDTKREAADAAAWNTKFFRLAPGHSTLGQVLCASDAVVNLSLVFHDEVLR